MGLFRLIEAGETVVEPNTQVLALYVVKSGQLDILKVSEGREEISAVCRPGTFTGELNVLSGRPGLVRIRASKPSELIEIGRDQLTALLQADSELSDIFPACLYPAAGAADRAGRRRCPCYRVQPFP